MTQNGNGTRERRWRDLPPIPEEERAGVEVGYVPEGGGPRRVSQTFLGKHDRCERAAFLYAKHDGGAGSHPLERGTVFHEFAARANRHLVAEGEKMIPPEVAKDLMLEVLEEEFHRVVPAGERDSLRAMAYNFAAGWGVEPESVVAVEETCELELGGWIIRGRIDFAQLVGTARIDVSDYKTSFAMPTQEEFESDFQTQLYALALAFGTLGSTGLRLGAGVEEFGLRQVFPRYLHDDGLAERFHLVTKQELLDLRLDVETQLRRLEGNIESGKWQAVPGSHCSECPSPNECPLPRHLRPDSQMVVGDLDAAEKLARWIVVEEERLKRARSRLKAFAENEGLEAIPAGTDYEFAFTFEEREEIVDKSEMWLAVEGAVEYGHPFDRAQHVRQRKSTRFGKRRVGR